MSKFLVTGGCGFIGAHLCARLVALGHQVCILDDLSSGVRGAAPDECEVRVQSVVDVQAVREAMRDTDGCFHLAAIASVEQSRNEWSKTHRTNQTGAINVFEAAAQGGGIPVVYASSAAVYGSPSSLPITEDAPLKPISPYGADKAGCELHAAVAADLFKVPVTGLRFFNVYGPRQNPHSPYSGVISKFVESAMQRKSLVVHGDGNQSRDFVFVDDVVSCLMAAMTQPAVTHRVINVCTGLPTTILELAELVKSIAKFPVDITFAGGRAGDIRFSYGSRRLLEDTLFAGKATELHVGLRSLFP